MEEQTFSKENIDNLSNVCYKIANLLEQNVDGSLMMTQLMFLGENIKEFVENPIVKNSGVL
jgi:hypothetical protein